MVCMAAILRSTRYDFGVGESFGHGVLDGFDRAHRGFCRYGRCDGLDWYGSSQRRLYNCVGLAGEGCEAVEEVSELLRTVEDAD